MKTIYLSRSFQPFSISSHAPGDIYSDTYGGECRRLTAKRLCLAAERAGKASDAILGLLEAIAGAAENGRYDGRAVADWYGLVGLSYEEKQAVYGHRVCSVCRRVYWAIDDYEGGDLCGRCWVEGMKIE